MKRKLILFAIVVSMSLSCTTRRENFKDFVSEFYLKGKVLETTQKFRNAIVHSYDSLIILTNTPSSEFQVHIYDTSLNHILSTGKIGGGPGEIANPFFAKVDNKKPLLYFLDMGKHRIFEYYLDSLILDHEALPLDRISLPREQTILDYNYHSEDNTFSYLNISSSKNLISFFNEKGEVLKSKHIPDQINLYDKNTEEINGQQIATYIYTKHPDLDYYVIAYRFSDVISIVDSEGKIISIKQGPDKINQIPDRTNVDIETTYTQLFCTKDFIYCLYKARDNKFQKRNKMETYDASTILVFDWDLTPQKRYNLEYSASNFTINPNNSKIITFCRDLGEIISYDLKK